MDIRSADQLAYNLKVEFLELAKGREAAQRLYNKAVAEGKEPAVRSSLRATVCAFEDRVAYLERLCQGVALYS